MAGRRFAADTASLRAAGACLGAESEVLGRALARLRSALAGASGAVGGDDQGRGFASRYDPGSAGLQEAAGRMVAGLERAGRALQAMADNYEAADASSQAGG